MEPQHKTKDMFVN